MTRSRSTRWRWWVPVLAPAMWLATPSFAVGQTVPDSVYPPPEPGQDFGPFPDDEADTTGVHFLLDLRYLTDDVWRGIERFDDQRSEDQLNLKINSRLSFDLGKLPHPFVDVVVNVAENDPVSSFQEIRPTVGFDWTVAPITLSAGYTHYIFPDREDLDTAEVFLRIELDDAQLFGADRPVLRPFVMAAYDFDTYEGLYIEAGLRHDMIFDGTGLTLSIHGQVQYVNDFELFAVSADDASGFQAWQAGVSASYSLNTLLNIPERFGTWSLQGFLNYTDGIDSDLLATDQLWGGGGIRLAF
jgi:hypothetical protein